MRDKTQILLLLLGQVLLVLALFGLFYYLAPWLDAMPIEEAERTAMMHPAPPPEAKSFTLGHNKITFHSHGTLYEKPFKFWSLVSLFVILSLVLMISIYYVIKLRNENNS